MMRILIVDDEQHILEDLGTELRVASYEVYTASSIDEAKEIISRYDLNCAIIDLKLDYTKFGGIEIYNFAKQRHPQIKTIILSGYVFDHLKEQLKKQPTYAHEAKNILEEIRANYVYKGGSQSYIDAVCEKLGVQDSDSAWYGVFHALLIAVQNYHYGNIPDLDYPIADVEKLNKVLTKYYHFNDDKISTLRDPSRAEILQKLYDLGKELTPKDNLFIFYAGHGCWSDVRKQGYWLPSDAKSDSPANWISNGDIRDFVQGIHTQHTLLISDACFSGAILKMRRGVSPAKTVKEMYGIKSRKVITSGDANQLVPDRSLFVDFLLDHLKENTDPYLYAAKLFVKIKDSFIARELAGQNPDYGHIRLADNEPGGDFIFAKKF